MHVLLAAYAARAIVIRSSESHLTPEEGYHNSDGKANPFRPEATLCFFGTLLDRDYAVEIGKPFIGELFQSFSLHQQRPPQFRMDFPFTNYSGKDRNCLRTACDPSVRMFSAIMSFRYIFLIQYRPES